MPSIKVKSIAFDREPPFRKLKDMTIELADRITVIAGHNGIGKSTIMALIANNSGLSRSEFKTLFGKTFQGNLFEVAYLDYEREYVAPKRENRLPEPRIEYLVNGSETVTKACSITGRSNSRKLRVVARSVPNAPFTSRDGKISFSGDAKIPLPTIYLGMTRMFPMGEAEPGSVVHTLDKTMADEERTFISEFINRVVVGSATRPSNITLTVKGTGKSSKHPEYSFDTRSISLGQDSLGAIATSLASFQKLKREWADYPGGLLIIDEIDAGLHPHSQRKLIDALRSASRKLNLQIIATTHSTHALKAVHSDGMEKGKMLDRVVYLVDTAQPWHAADYSLAEILDDMDLIAPALAPKEKKKELPVFFEDDEANFVFDKLVPVGRRRSIGNANGVSLKPIALGTGGTNLVGLGKRAKLFRSTVIVVDADTPVTGKPKEIDHIVKLAGGRDVNGRGLSPERTLHAYLTDLVENPNDHVAAWQDLRPRRITADQIRAHLLSGNENMNDRVSAKRWWTNNIEHIEGWSLYELWAKHHPQIVSAFRDSLSAAVKAVSERLA